MQIDGNTLIGYTDWERQKWHDWLAIILGLSRPVWGLTATIKPSAKS